MFEAKGFKKTEDQTDAEANMKQAADAINKWQSMLKDKFNHFRDNFVEANDDLKKSYIEFAEVRDKFRTDYAKSQKSYQEHCGPFENRYGIDHKCGNEFHKVQAEFLKRRDYPFSLLGKFNSYQTKADEIKKASMDGILDLAALTTIKRPKHEKAPRRAPVVPMHANQFL